MLIGGGGVRKTLRLVARHADIWHSFGDADEVRRKTAVLDEWCEREGRDRSEIELSVGAQGQPETTPRLGPAYDLRGTVRRDEVNAARS